MAIVDPILKNLGVKYFNVNFEKIDTLDIVEELTINKKTCLDVSLFKSGLELIEERKAVLIEKIKNAVIDLVYFEEVMPKIKNSDYIKNKLNYDYTYLSNVFSEKMGSTIENYIITQKIERVKQLLIFNELNLTEISYKLNYSSVAHLSTQFKKITGFTPSSFKQSKHYD